MATETRTNRKTHVEIAAAVFGWAFVVIGVLGFIPGVTTNYDTMELYGHESEALLLGIFAVSILHNAVHLGFGIWGVTAARTVKASRIFLLAGGAAYAGLWLYGILVDRASDANFVPLNTADNWLHLGLAIGMIGSGALLSRSSGRPGTDPGAGSSRGTTDL